MYLKEIGLQGVQCMYLAHDMARWRAFVNAVMNFRVQ
jgi:hypothetical protein